MKSIIPAFASATVGLFMLADTASAQFTERYIMRPPGEIPNYGQHLRRVPSFNRDTVTREELPPIGESQQVTTEPRDIKPVILNPSLPEVKVDCNNAAMRYCKASVEDVAYVPDADLPVGSIVISVKNRTLYFIKENGMARRYPIATGRKGVVMPAGDSFIYRKAEWPDWYPTEEMQYKKNLPPKIKGGPNNPLGRVAMYLKGYKSNRDDLYRIHGTDDEKSIGTDASSGCFRMFNADALELYGLIAAYDDKNTGTRVRVIDVPPRPRPEMASTIPSYERAPQYQQQRRQPRNFLEQLFGL